MTKPITITPLPSESTPKLRTKLFKERDKQIKKLSQQEAKILKKVAAIEQAKADITKGLADLKKLALGKRKSLVDRVTAYEGGIVRAALKAQDGMVTKAAVTLGMSYQGLAYMIKERHPELLKVRRAIRPRKGNK